MISEVRQRGAMVSITGLAAPREAAGDPREQTRLVLRDIERELETLGSSKSRVLTARVRLADPSLREEHEAAWQEWVSPETRPLKSFGAAPLEHPGALEIVVTATR